MMKIFAHSITRKCSPAMIMVLLTACATSSQVRHIDRLEAVDNENPKILAITPDIKYFLLTAGGVPQPHGEWTSSARENFVNALKQYASDHNLDVAVMDYDARLGETEVAYQKLYSAVGATILVHQFGNTPLPTKQGSFDWSLGPGVQAIAKKYDADYALFSFYRDYQASGGRVAFAILAAAVGVGISTGGEGGYASLVDLKTGDIVWFNMVSVGAGELREKDGARAAVDELFADLPHR